MLKKLFNRRKPLTMHHPQFGRLTFIRISEPAKSYWEGAGVFPATMTSIEFFIDANEDGPGDSQWNFYVSLSDRYVELCLAIEPVLKQNYEEWLHKPAPDDVWNSFQLSSLSIPRSRDDESDWEMSFECSDDVEHLFTVQMRGMQPAGMITIDG